jgi:hypothetical protein
MTDAWDRWGDTCRHAGIPGFELGRLKPGRPFVSRLIPDLHCGLEDARYPACLVETLASSKLPAEGSA